jgi:chromate transporter
MGAFLDTVNIASVAIIGAVCLEMTRAAVTGWRSAAIGILSAIVVFGFPKVNTAYIVLGGAVMGYLLYVLPFG